MTVKLPGSLSLGVFKTVQGWCAAAWTDKGVSALVIPEVTKEKAYQKLCTENPNFYFISTNEDDIYNLKDRLGVKLNQTPLKKAIWK